MTRSLLAALWLTAAAGAAWGAPAQAPRPGKPAKWFALHKPYWSLGLKGGAALPLGELALYNGAGGSFGASLIYQGTRQVGTDFFVTYSSQPYKLGGGATPLNNTGVGIRLIYEVMRVEALNAWAGVGGGYYFTQRTRQVLKQPLTTPLQYTAEAHQAGGLGLCFGFGSSYRVTASLAVTLDVNLVNIALAGGTADSIALGVPSLGLRYDF